MTPSPLSVGVATTVGGAVLYPIIYSDVPLALSSQMGAAIGALVGLGYLGVFLFTRYTVTSKWIPSKIGDSNLAGVATVGSFVARPDPGDSGRMFITDAYTGKEWLISNRQAATFSNISMA